MEAKFPKSSEEQKLFSKKYDLGPFPIGLELSEFLPNVAYVEDPTDQFEEVDVFVSTNKVALFAFSYDTELQGSPKLQHFLKRSTFCVGRST